MFLWQKKNWSSTPKRVNWYSYLPKSQFQEPSRLFNQQPSTNCWWFSTNLGVSRSRDVDQIHLRGVGLGHRLVATNCVLQILETAGIWLQLFKSEPKRVVEYGQPNLEFCVVFYGPFKNLWKNTSRKPGIEQEVTRSSEKCFLTETIGLNGLREFHQTAGPQT